MKTKKCQTCGEKNTKKLTKNSSRRNAKGELVENFLCRSCRNKRRANWYHTHKEAKEVVMMNNLRSLARKFGYKLIKQ